jgi:signal transduction histidine kinase
MEERADALGGNLTVTGAVGGGTVVKISIPVAST